MTNYIENKKLRIRTAEQLQEKLNNTDFTQTDIAIKSGITRTTLWAIRKGHTIPNAATINKIEEVLK